MSAATSPRILFQLVLLAVSVYYSVLAFELAWEAGGRIGPGFFPRMMGPALVALLLLSVFRDLRAGITDEPHPYLKIQIVVSALTVLFVPALLNLGMPISVFLYMIITLTVLNRGRVVQNVLLSVGVPLVLYLLFDVWLNATLPRPSLPLLG